MNRREELYMVIRRGKLAAKDGYGFYELVEKGRATSLVLRANKLEGKEKEVVVMDFSNSDVALIYQSKERINEHGLPYYRGRKIQKKSALTLGRRLYYDVNEMPEGWINIPEGLEIEKCYQGITGISVAELVFIGYKVYQSKITGNPVGNEVELWLNDKEYIIEKATRQEQEQGLSVYGYILRKQRSQPENSIATEPVATEPVGIAEIDDKEIAMFPLFSKEEAIERISRLKAAFFKGRDENV